MNKKEIIEALEKLLKEFQNKEMDCFRDIGYMNEHKFHMESEALQYKKEAYTDCWLRLNSVIDKINN